GGEDALPFFLHACPHIEWSGDRSTRSMGNAMRFSEARVKWHSSLKTRALRDKNYMKRELGGCCVSFRLDLTRWTLLSMAILDRSDDELKAMLAAGVLGE